MGKKVFPSCLMLRDILSQADLALCAAQMFNTFIIYNESRKMPVKFIGSKTCLTLRLLDSPCKTF